MYNKTATTGSETYSGIKEQKGMETSIVMMIPIGWQLSPVQVCIHSLRELETRSEVKIHIGSNWTHKIDEAIQVEEGIGFMAGPKM